MQPSQRIRQTADIERHTSPERGREKVGAYAAAVGISTQDDCLRDALVERQRPRLALQFELQPTCQAERPGLSGGGAQPG